jgi:hypothetical protein
MLPVHGKHFFYDSFKDNPDFTRKTLLKNAKQHQKLHGILSPA